MKLGKSGNFGAGGKSGNFGILISGILGNSGRVGAAGNFNNGKFKFPNPRVGKFNDGI